MGKIWSIKTPDQRVARRISRKTGCHPVTASVLVNRGLEREDDIAAFLYPSISKIDTFFSLKDMDGAVVRIAEAIAKRQKILVFGDYDVDGITSASIVWWFLREAGADADIYIPHRIEEGYGLRPSHVKDMFAPGKIDLVITTDCGSGSHDAVLAANTAGIDVIITDHHDIDHLPAACAVVNPKRKDCTAGLEHLAGVGVAFYLLVCLRKHLRDAGFWDNAGKNNASEPNLKNICDLVALGTIADVVPLVRENRIIAKTGMDVINASPRCGIRALIDACGISKPVLDTEDLAFRIVPRLNAAGRLDHAMTAARLLDTTEADTAASLAADVNTLNAERQRIEQAMQQKISAYLAQEDELDRFKTIVLADTQWHQGVLGIVASRLAEKFFRPVVLFAINDGVAVGSARSVPGIDLFESLSRCGHLLEAYGGHAMAAGLTIKGSNFKEFRQAFDDCITSTYPESVFSPTLEIDCTLDFDRISDTLANELLMLAPFGEENPEPIFAAQNIVVRHARIVGGKHLQMTLSQTGSQTGKILPAIAFNVDPEKSLPKGFEKIAYRLRWNHYNGKQKLQLLVEAMDGGMK